MSGNKEPKKEGLSVKELESFTKKHRMEVFFCLFFFLAGIFGLILWGSSWCVILGAIGAIIGALMPIRVRAFAKGMWQFVFRQDRTTQIIMASVALVLAVFLPFVVFLLIGLHAGKSMAMDAHESSMGRIE